ncbi:MAG: hypothetical protein LBH35_06740 [Treponema sp.]|jgi:hypothetical protein|nr:hypothetical protein [Treponema sp.]
MKKLAILFLLTTVLISFTFAQVSVKGGLDLGNLTGGKTAGLDGELTPVLYTEINGKASTALGPGAIGAEVQFGTALNFQEDTAAYTGHGDMFLKGFYELPAGPGTLGIAISTWPHFGGLHFNVGYTGLAAGPATLGFEVEYDFITDGIKDAVAGTSGVFSDDGKEDDAIDLKLTADFAFGLGIEYHFNYVLSDADNYIAEIAKLNISYQVMPPLKVGAELTGTGGWNFADNEQAFFGGEGTTGLGLRPYAEYAISEKLTAGLEIPISQLNADDSLDLIVGAGVWIKYVF